jgi:hypothetical protein
VVTKVPCPAIVFFGKQLVGMFKTCSCRSAYEILCVSFLGAADFSSTLSKSFCNTFPPSGDHYKICKIFFVYYEMTLKVYLSGRYNSF